MRIFVAAAKSGSFSAAARKLFLSHSTVSRAISSLEDELGVQLFIRNNKNSVLSQYGQVLLSDADEILERIDSMECRLKALQNADIK